MTTTNQTKINFQDQSAGTIINGQYAAQGVTISSANGDTPPMIFDTSHPTGGDTDLATSNLGNVLILSEDGDSSDPDDNAGGGTFRFDFDGEVTVDSITLLDVEEGAWIKVFDEHGRLLEQIDARTADNGQLTVNIDTPGAAFMTIQLAGSGAVDNLKFTPVPQLDGVVNGTAGGDLIDTAFVDAQGDRIDANDALGVEGTTGDEDLVLAGRGNDTVFAGVGDDIVRGEDGNDRLFGQSGNDVLDGGAGNDQLTGGTGNDTLLGGSGRDSIFGGDGDDQIEGGTGDDRIEGGDGADFIQGGNGNDLIVGFDAKSVASGGTEVLTDDGANDTLLGGAGRDTVLGGKGDDLIDGGAGADMLFGGDDRDVIFGATTGDVIDGGAGGDDFDTLDLTGSDVAFITFDPDNGENGVITFRDETTAKFQDIESVVPCFTPGTQIATPRGEVAVQDLVVGDRVITRDNGIQVIRWIGRRDLTAADLTANETLRAVMVRQGALGHGLPERDMIVSPQHRILISNDETMLYFDEREVLVAAKHLVGRPGVERMDVTDISYIHVMFDNHEVILSDGAWTESFQPGDHSLKGLGKAQREEIFAIFPELREEEGREEYTAARRMLRRQEAELLAR